MTQEELEFHISQYADGTLPVEQVAALEEILRIDASAQQLLREYRQIDDSLKSQLPPLPDVQWGRLQDYLSDAVETEATVRSPQSLLRLRWPARLSMAAAILLAVGLTLVMVMQTLQTVPVAQIMGPRAERATGQAIAEIEIGPSPALAEYERTWQHAEGFVARPSRITIAGDLPKDVRPSY